MRARREPSRPVAGWTIEELRGGVDEIHDRPMPSTLSRPELWLAAPQRAGLVLGSRQRDLAVDRRLAARWKVDVVTRRSGGGAVLVEPADLLWIDLLIPVGHPLWHDDIGHGAVAVGRIWAAALRSLGHDASVHTGAMESGQFGELACFAGLGPGEVLIEGAKVVGISQRRVRGAARFQCAALLAWRPERLVALLAAAPDLDPDALLADLQRTARPADVTADELTSSLLASLELP